MRLRLLGDWPVSLDAIFYCGKFQIIPLAQATDGDSEGERNRRQLLPLKSGQAETIEAKGKRQGQDQCSLGLKSRISEQTKSGSHILKSGGQE